MHFLDVSDSEEEFKDEEVVFVKVDAVKQQKAKSKSPSSATLDPKNKIVKEHQQHHANLPFMRSV